jgi:hypothetical protein
MDLLLFFMLPALPILVAPRGWARAVAGWIMLWVGLSLIKAKSRTPSPFDDDGIGADFGDAFLIISSLAIGAALLIRWRALIYGPKAEDRGAVTRWLGDWAIPLGFLFAAAFLHWLSNRLAGTSPAWLLHVMLVLAASGFAAAMVWRSGWSFALTKATSRLGFALSAAFAVLVMWDAVQGFTMWSRAERFADGSPWCAMTYGGFEHERRALSGWDLSPLVNRHYGNWAVSKALFLTVGSGSEARSYRWYVGRFREEGRGSPECLPPAGRAA